MYSKSIYGLLIVLMGCLWVNPAWTQESAPPQIWPHAREITPKTATRLRLKLLPLIHAQKYKQASKLATEQLGDNWCDIRLKGRDSGEHAGEDTPKTSQNWQPHFALFGGLTVLARQLGNLEMAADCAITSTEYTTQPRSIGMVAFELALIAQKMQPEAFARFYDTYFGSGEIAKQRRSQCVGATFQELENAVYSWRGSIGLAKIDARNASKNEKGDSAAQTSEPYAWMKEVPAAQKQKALKKVVDKWLRLSFRLNPTPSVAKRLLERKVLPREKIASYSSAILPSRVPAPSGPFESFEKAAAWAKVDTRRELNSLKINIGDREEVDKSEVKWNRAKTAPFQIAVVSVYEMYLDGDFEAPKPSDFCRATDSQFLFMRESDNSAIYVMPITYGVPHNNSCGGYGDSNYGASASWFKDGSKESKYLGIYSSYAGYINDACGPIFWDSNELIYCGGDTPQAVQCVAFGTQGQLFGQYYGVGSFDASGVVRINERPENLVPTLFEPIIKRMDGKSLEEIYQNLEAWRAEAVERVLGTSK